MSETINYGFYVDSDDTTKFIEWREKVAGETGSNMVKIDAALKAHADTLDWKQSRLTGTQGQVVGFDADGNAVAQAPPDAGVSMEQVAEAVNTMGASKQDKLTGTAGQVVGFDANGQAVAQEAPEGGVISFHGRKGEVAPQSGDYTADDVGASPIGHKHSKNDISDFPASLPASDVHDWAKSASKPSYTASEVGASEAGHTHTAAQIGAKASSWKPFHVGTSAPSDTSQLWIDTTANTGGLKYHNGSAWVYVPVAYTYNHMWKLGISRVRSKEWIKNC